MSALLSATITLITLITLTTQSVLLPALLSVPTLPPLPTLGTTLASLPMDAVLWFLERWSNLLAMLGSQFGIEMFQYAFMHRAFLVGLLIGIMAPLIGTFLVHRQLALIGDALAHTAFAGVAVGLFVNAVFDAGVSPYLTAVVVAMIAALAIELISEVTDAYNDVSMAIVLSTGFALGAVLISVNAGGLAVGVNQSCSETSRRSRSRTPSSSSGCSS